MTKYYWRLQAQDMKYLRAEQENYESEISQVTCHSVYIEILYMQ